jgi:hypothetical protein
MTLEECWGELFIVDGRPESVNMKDYVKILLSLLILAAAVVGAYRGADALQYSLFTYQSPLSVAQIPPGEPMPPQTERVVMVIVGGLGQDTTRSVDMPNLETLVEAGASASMVSHPPTYPLPAWTTLLTGLWPELNNAPIMEPRAYGLRPITFDHLFATARDAGMRTAVAGFEGWKPLISADSSVFTSDEDAITDAQVAQAALTFIADSQYNLILIYFHQLNVIGQTEGVSSASYARAARQVDNHLQQIIRLVDLSNSVLIVTSDHGLLENGRLGGSESELTRLPFAMIGQRVIPGVYSPVRQIDLAPTVAALLGTRLPTFAQGRPLYEMMQLDEVSLTRGQLQVATQKVALSDAYSLAIGADGLSQVTYRDLDSAQQTYQNGNQAGAFEFAKLVAEEATVEMASAQETRIARERWLRLIGVAVGLLVPLLLLWARRGPHLLVGIIAGGVASALYYALYRLGGYTFSLSAIGATDAYVTTLLRYATIGLGSGGVLLLAGLLYRDERRWSAAVTAGYDYGLFATFLSALPALVGYWQHGATIRWYLPDLGLTLLHFVALVQVGVLALGAIPLPWFIALVAWGLGRWRTYSESRVQTWDPIARLRRR